MQFTCAREMFEATRDAALDLERCERQLRTLESREGLTGSIVKHGPSARPDPMTQTDVRIDFESAIKKRMDDDTALIDATAKVLYGSEQNGDGGVASLAGSLAADCARWRYILAAKWDEIAQALNVSQRTARRQCDVAIETADTFGYIFTVSGVGFAEM